MFTLHIKTGNDAFNPAAEECARLLRLVADALEKGTTGAPLFDFNGNHCGRFDLRLPEED